MGREKKFTPGPWKLSGADFIYHLNDNGHNSFEISIGRGCVCCDCRKLPPVDTAAITTLLEVAPELLDIVERLVMYYDHGDLFPEEKYKIDEAKRAIVKAYGEKP